MNLLLEVFKANQFQILSSLITLFLLSIPLINYLTKEKSKNKITYIIVFGTFFMATMFHFSYMLGKQLAINDRATETTIQN